MTENSYNSLRIDPDSGSTLRISGLRAPSALAGTRCQNCRASDVRSQSEHMGSRCSIQQHLVPKGHPMAWPSQNPSTGTRSKMHAYDCVRRCRLAHQQRVGDVEDDAGREGRHHAVGRERLLRLRCEPDQLSAAEGDPGGHRDHEAAEAPVSIKMRKGHLARQTASGTRPARGRMHAVRIRSHCRFRHKGTESLR